MSFFILDPDVAGGFGPGTTLDRSVHPPIVQNLVYEFADWSGDDIVASFPCFLVTERFRGVVHATGLRGCRFEEKFTIATAPEFAERTPGALPKFLWLQIEKSTNDQDFWLADDFRLAVSARAYRALAALRLSNCQVEEQA